MILFDRRQNVQKIGLDKKLRTKHASTGWLSCEPDISTVCA